MEDATRLFSLARLKERQLIAGYILAHDRVCAEFVALSIIAVKVSVVDDQIRRIRHRKRLYRLVEAGVRNFRIDPCQSVAEPSFQDDLGITRTLGIGRVRGNIRAVNPALSQFFKPVQAGVFEHGFGDACHDSARFIDVHLRFARSFNDLPVALFPAANSAQQSEGLKFLHVTLNRTFGNVDPFGDLSNRY